MIVDRIRGLARVPGSRLRAADENFRVHDARQRKVLKGLLAEVGIIGAVLAWVPDDMARAALRSSQDFAAWLAGYDGPLQLVDGHMRAEELKGQAIPVLVTDLSRAEAAKALATFDAVGDLAGRDAQKLAALLEDVGRGAEEGTEELLAALRGGEGESEPKSGESAADDAEPMQPEAAKTTLAQRFIVPPFSVLDARQGYWQERKRAWLALGIRSELGRGEDLAALGGGSNAGRRSNATPGGAMMPACDYSARQRGDGRGRAV